MSAYRDYIDRISDPYEQYMRIDVQDYEDLRQLERDYEDLLELEECEELLELEEDDEDLFEPEEDDEELLEPEEDDEELLEPEEEVSIPRQVRLDRQIPPKESMKEETSR